MCFPGCTSHVRHPQYTPEKTPRPRRLTHSRPAGRGAAMLPRANIVQIPDGRARVVQTQSRNRAKIVRRFAPWCGPSTEILSKWIERESPHHRKTCDAG